MGNKNISHGLKFSLGQIADYVGGKVFGDAGRQIWGTAPFESASENDMTYAEQPKFLKRLDQTRAGAVIVLKSFEIPNRDIIQVSNPRVAFAKVTELFHPKSTLKPGIHPTSSMGDDRVWGKDVSIAAFASIGNHVTFGNRVMIFPHVFIGDHVTIGDDVTIYPNVTILERTRIGNRVIIHSGTVIGSDGFGFAPDGETYYKIPHTGFVQIDDDVEIGACNAIDRGTFDKTWIQRGVKTDNLVHIAHNVIVGENTLLVAQVGISGSVTIGKHAILAGQAGISQHLNLGNHVIVGPQAGVSADIPDGEVVSGSPQLPHRQWLRVQGTLSRLPDLKKQVSDLEKRMKRLEERWDKGSE